MEKARKNELLPAFVAEHLLVSLVTAVILVVAGILISEEAVEEARVADLSSPAPSPVPQTVFPDLSLAASVGERKTMFLDFIQDYINEQNYLITLDRLRLLGDGSGLLAEKPEV